MTSRALVTSRPIRSPCWCSSCACWSAVNGRCVFPPLFLLSFRFLFFFLVLIARLYFSQHLYAQLLVCCCPDRIAVDVRIGNIPQLIRDWNVSLPVILSIFPVYERSFSVLLGFTGISIKWIFGVSNGITGFHWVLLSLPSFQREALRLTCADEWVLSKWQRTGVNVFRFRECLFRPDGTLGRKPNAQRKPESR